MRTLDDNEQGLLRQLDGVVPTDALVTMLKDLAEILEGEGLVVRARVVTVAAARLVSLQHHRER